MKSSKKLVPRLFGVNKESIVRVDERTKDVLQVGNTGTCWSIGK